MHAILFAIKRTFHKSNWFGRFLLHDYALTPSRFDILYILQTHRPLPSLWHSRIREILGIASTTLSRMTKALEQLGYIRRARSLLDSRQLDISLTERGRDMVAHALRKIVKSGIITNVMVHFICENWPCPIETLEGLERLQKTLRHMRDRLLDDATLFYPWHPDDERFVPVRPRL